MTIRLLHSREVSKTLENGKRFFEEGKMPGRFDPAYFSQCWKDYIEAGTGEVIAMFDGEQILGALGAIYYRDPLTGDLVATEQYWFMDPAHRGSGLKLLEQFEAQAKKRGCRRMSMIHLSNLHPKALKRVYEREGFREIETAYMKELI